MSHPFPPPPLPGPIERVVLLGYMCSGKSTVGDSLARRLAWRYLDFDVEIERREGVPVGVIVERRGPDFFRMLEARLTEEVAGERHLVVAPGGGWITQPDLLERIRPGTYSAWLRVSPEETVRRLMTDTIDRPFRTLAEPLEPIRQMIAEREPLYRLADATVPTDGRQVEEIAFEIEQLVRTRGVARL